MKHNVKLLYDEGVLRKPFIYNFCLGVKGALPASADNIHFLKSITPSDSAWGVMHHSMSDLSLLAAAIGMGASFVRVGFEDSVNLAPGKVAKTNVELVKNVVLLIRQMGMAVAIMAVLRMLRRKTNKTSVAKIPP